ncbi:MAG: hypothetical protein ISR69_15305 [Gammaproteobacteria bacterium]|nr:hypothetical protein [Gammaproteobacteria bacterium]
MNDLKRWLYDYACEVYGGNIAGECANVSHMMLKEAKEAFGDDMTIAVGWVSINGDILFKASANDSPEFFNNKLRFKYHVWLHNSHDIIDLTLVQTLRDMDSFDSSLISENITYIDCKLAAELGITHHLQTCGDGVLEELQLG